MITSIENSATFKLLLTLKEAADSLSVCERTISRLVDRGELHPVKVGPRGVRIGVADLQRWIEKQQNAGVQS